MADRNPLARTVFLAAAVSLALISGCIFDSSDDGGYPEPRPLEYKTPDSAENTLYNVYVAFATRDLAGYDGLLASDFIYRFSPDDSPEGLGSCDGEWSREEEMAALGTMFDAPQITDILFNLPEVQAVPVTEVGLPEDAMRIRLTGVRFLVDEDDGTSYLTRDDVTHDLFFRPGRSGAGEDTASWYLFLWRDVPPARAPGIRVLSEPTPVRDTYWWEIKCRWAP